MADNKPKQEAEKKEAPATEPEAKPETKPETKPEAKKETFGRTRKVVDGKPCVERLSANGQVIRTFLKADKAE